MNLATRTLILLVLAGGLFWQLPLFRVVRVEERDSRQYTGAFNAADFAANFWSERLLPALEETADARTVLAALQSEPQQAREQFGRKVGVSRSRLFILRGSGTIVGVEKQCVGVAFDGEHAEPDVLLHTGLLFGNAVRDCTGLLNASDFPNSQHFNELSTELNRRVEEQVIAVLKDNASLGRRIQFVGCAEVPDHATELRPLKLVPLNVQID